MKRWLITGGCGFIGSSLVRELAKDDDNSIVVIDNLSTGSAKFLPNSVELIEDDINNILSYKFWKDVDVIVHLAAQSGVRPSLKNPEESFNSNVMGTFKLLEAARKNNVKRFVNASSGACTGEHEGFLHEKLPGCPVSVYGATKLCGEALVTSYFHSFGIDTVSLRFSNVYGPFSSHKESIVAKFIKKIIDGETLEIYGDGTQTRDFIYIDDLVRSIILAATEKNIGGEVFQISTSTETSINIITAKMMNIFLDKGYEPEFERVSPKKGDLRKSVASYNKAWRMMKWAPKISLNDGLQRTVNWFLENQE